MSTPNPFTPPGARLGDRPDLAPGSPMKAVAVGVAVDIGATMIGGGVFAVVFAVGYSALGARAEDLAALVQPASWSPYAIAMLALGCACSALGGFTCARIARRDEARLGWIVAGISVLVGVLLGSDAIAEAIDQVVIGALLTVIGVLVGTRLGAAKNRRDEAAIPGGAG